MAHQQYKFLFQQQKEIRDHGKYYASFTVDPASRQEASPHSLAVQEDEALSCLDADNPDRWVLKGSGAERGRLNAVCLLEKPVAHHRQATGAGGKGTNPREQFREEVLTVSNKQQEALMKRR